MDEKNRYLNLQEQVGKNKHDVEELRTVKFNLERAGVRVVGEEASASDLPDPVTYTGQLGDAYLIGTEAPYDMYIYTQPSVGETNFKWFNIGAFPALGPQGKVGPEGPRGPQGDSSNWRFGTVNPAILDTDREHDGYLNTTTGMVFEFSGTNWIPIGSIQGPRGNQGPIGPQGPTGRTGAQGNQGPQGPAGITIEIIGVVDTIGSLPDPSTVSRNAGYILESGDDKNLYIIVEDENQDLTWYDAGAFAGVPGTPAGFGTISATVTPITPGTAPSVTVATSGTNEAKNIAFAFSIPVGAELENTAAGTPSETKGYTQKVIDQKTMDFVIKKPSDLGFTDGELPVSIFDVMQKITAQYTDMDIVIINESANENIKDAPSTIGQLFIRTGKGGMTPLAMWVDNVYNVHLFYGTDGNIPANPVWYRIMTTKDAAGIGTPAGGTTGQLLAKRSDEDFDTVWEDVPNAPNGIPVGGTTGKILVKKSDTDYDTEWQTKPTGIPNGGTTGQIIKKQSGNDGDVAWENAPVGLPAGGTTGQVLQKTSGTDFDVEWATPAAGGGSGKVLQFTDNLLINHNFLINQRGNATYTYSNTNNYSIDRWYLTTFDNTGTLTSRSSEATAAVIYKATITQYNYATTKIKGYMLGVVEYVKSADNMGDPLINVRKANSILTPIEDGIIQNGTTYKYWALYSVDYDIGDRWAFNLQSDANKETHLKDSALYILNDVPEIDEYTNINIFYEGPIIEYEKCQHYYQDMFADTNYPKILAIMSPIAYESGTMNIISVALGAGLKIKPMRVAPTTIGSVIRATIKTVTSGGTIDNSLNTSISVTTGKNAITLGANFYLTDKYAVLGSGNFESSGTRKLRLDAEIYP